MTPDMFGPYQLRGLIGRGGMGEVHRAYDTRRQRTVALKRLRVEFVADERFRERFLKECRRAARLTQAHVIPIHDFGEIDGRLYLDMRLIEGHNLAEAVTAAGPFSPERAVEIVGQIAGALDAAHAAGIVHRDVKPANVLVETHGPSMHCYLTDFGVAGAIGDTGGVSGTATGGVLGTYDYIAPERLLGRPSDRRVDVYALACLLYEVVTGTPPFRRDEIPAMIHAHLNVEPPRASQVVAGVPPMLDAVIARGMAKDPRARYPTAGELAEAARFAILGDGAASPAAVRSVPYPSARTQDADLTTVPVRARRRPRRRTAGLLVAAVLALAIAGTSTAVTWYFLRPVVHLEGATFVGAEPPFIPEDLNAPAAPPSTQEVVHAAASVVAGDTPGLYGGTRANECNVAGMERYLDAHPDRAQAWARAEGVDPGAIHRVLTSLTPVTLRTDTAVTNHGFKNGRPTQFQSVLQADTAVLVDTLGVPRVRCYCGNPLLRPEQPPSVRYEGPTWTTFSTGSVTVVNKAAAPVTEFVVVERETKKVVSRPRATSGEKDHDADPAIVKKVKDKPIGEGTTSSRSNANTDGSQGGKDPNGDVPADQLDNRNKPPDNPPDSPDNPPANPGETPANPDNPPANPGETPANPDNPPANPGEPPNPGETPANPDAPPANPGLPKEPADEQGPPVDPAAPLAPPVDPAAPLAPPVDPAGSPGQAGPADDPAPAAEPAPVKKPPPVKPKAPVKKKPPVKPPPPAKPPPPPPAQKPATDNPPGDQPAPHRGSTGNGNGSGSTGGSGSGESNPGGSGSGGDSGGGDSGGGDSGGGDSGDG